MKIEIPAIDNITSAAKEFLQKVINPPLEEVGLLFADSVKLWRFQNQVKILTKAEKILKKKGVKMRKVSLKVMTPLLEECSVEEDISMQDKWATLIANTVSEGSQLDTTLYSHILSQLTRGEAELFEVIYEHSTTTHKSEGLSTVIKGYNVLHVKNLRTTIKDFDLKLDNLLRLRLVKDLHSRSVDSEVVTLTDLGFRFMTTVREI